ncbi:Mu-like prophage major head subunit gpT family protein [Endozoicomonas sp. SM1973]|uniref:Mu-like prophage major head subunit gpT family protein n=1 Tax=Spartinivicinus marinus TaxID=2994442 RepID=A0A853IAY6_9GAMM|nr:Mu-like prophage major head subunit gpT family protein [Spartinivicinus marinus]MCX4025054.1 Mu-like prophage major head subunit gpT family protein [Spartinivicinus marinus]NYZ68992.1 Mu-like prophage major head subunit gpT family protein [Spartinivicinus marinus]
MAIITPQLLKSLFTGYKTNFQKGLGMAEPQYNQIATTVPSSTASNTYGWLGQWPGFREWIGDRVIKSMEAHGYQIFNKQFESSVGVKRTDIEDDNLGIYSPMFEEMGRATTAFPDELTFPLLANGFISLCYDGQNFFDEDHPVNSQVDGQGTDQSVSNIIKDPNYKGPTWYVMDTTRAIKPIIFQERKKPKFVAMTKEEDESVFMRGEYRYGVDLRCNVGFSFWQMAIAVQAEFSTDSLWEAKTKMSEYKADGGRPLNLNPNLIVAPAGLEKKITQTLNRELIQDGNTTVSNELKGAFKTLISRRL